MAPELSQNWKILQARLKASSTSTTSSSSSLSSSTTSKPAAKRKAPSDESARDSKKQKQSSTLANRSFHPPPKLTSKPKPSTQKMGAAHSTLLPLSATPSTALPSLQLLTSKHDDINAESLAEAYSLGLSASTLKSLPTAPNEGLSPAVASVDSLGKYLALDCEMVGVGPGGHESALARVSVTDFHGKQIYDSYVKPREKVTDWRTHVSGIQPKHMRLAREFQDVQQQVSELLRGRVVVGHDVKHDLKALELDHSTKTIRDTAKFSGFRKYGHGPKPSLKVLAKEVLGLESFQQGQHSSVEDARVAMMLFRRHKSAFDVEHANKFPDEAAAAGKGKRRVDYKGKAKKARRG